MGIFDFLKGKSKLEKIDDKFRRLVAGHKDQSYNLHLTVLINELNNLLVTAKDNEKKQIQSLINEITAAKK